MRKSLFSILIATFLLFLSGVLYAGGTKGDIRASLLFPGVFAGNKTINFMMNSAIEGEYFIFDNFSAGIRAGVATDFTKTSGEIDTLILAGPFARYDFDFRQAPDWHVYVQFLAGVAVADTSETMADISFPSGGIYWEWTEKLSIGADLGLHILVHPDTTAVGFHIGPRLTYNF